MYHTSFSPVTTTLNEASVAAGLTCVLWDHALTFDDEYAYIWSRQWTFTKALFVANRYTAEAGLIYAAYSMLYSHPS